MKVRFTLCICFVVVAALALLPSPVLTAHGRPDALVSQAASVALLQQGGGRLVVYQDALTGVPNFIAGEVPAVKAEVDTPLDAARAFFRENAALFRMTDPAAELQVVRAERDAVGMDHVRFQQQVHGVDVFGGLLIAHMRGTRVAAITGTYFPEVVVNTQPDISLDQASERAKVEVEAPEAVVVAQRSGLVIYAKGQRNALTWAVELWSAARPGRWLVFVNAHSGRIEHRMTLLETALNRLTYNASNGTTLPGTLVCSDVPADPTCGDTVLQAAHDNAGTVYNYYKSKFNRESINNAGMALISTAHFDVDYDNAFWNGDQMVYGDGDGVYFSPLSQSLDVVAHELTHGVTQYTANLVYEDEPGALNESYSDVMGVFADDYGNGAAAINWQIGESIWTPGINGDALRDMADPHKGNDFFVLSNYTCQYRPAQPGYCGQPATYSEYARYPVSFDIATDSGGVHTNSGIPNKAAYLLVQGGTFGGVTVAPIGVSKAEQIYYRTLSMYLTPYSNFITARNSSIQACTDLIGQFGISAGDCASVRAAFAAVGVGANTTYAYQSFVPMTMKNTATTNTPALRGGITFNGTPIAGVTVVLRRCSTVTSSCPQITSATTNAVGTYSFPAGASIPSTDDNTWYRVVYSSPSAAPDGKLLMWFSDELQVYQQGNSHLFDTFDIADVALGSPNSSTPRAFPVQFTWTARAVGGDMYLWESYDANFNVIAQASGSLMQTSPTFQLNSASDPQLAGGSALHGTQFWDVLVIAHSGYGYTWNTNRVAFSGVLADQGQVFAARRALAERLVNEPYPRVFVRQ